MAVWVGGAAGVGLWKFGALNAVSAGIVAGCVVLVVVVVAVMAAMARKRVATVGGGLAATLARAEKLAAALPSQLEAEANAEIVALETGLDA